jgi:hypothetical protein
MLSMGAISLASLVGLSSLTAKPLFGVLDVSAFQLDYGSGHWKITITADGATTSGAATQRDSALGSVEVVSGQFASVVKTKLNGRAVIKLTIREGGHGMVQVITLWGAGGTPTRLNPPTFRPPPRTSPS